MTGKVKPTLYEQAMAQETWTTLISTAISTLADGEIGIKFDPGTLMISTHPIVGDHLFSSETLTSAPLSRRQAKKLDRRIRRLCST